jgi:hypothetical protein
MIRVNGTKNGDKKRKAPPLSSDSESSSSDESLPSRRRTSTSGKSEATPNKEVVRQSSTKPIQLKVPSFSLKSRVIDSDRYELWSIRLPASLPVEALDGCELAVPSVAASCASGGPVAAPVDEDPSTAKKNNKEHLASFSTQKGDIFALRWGNPVENETFRVLVPHPRHNRAGDDDDDKDEDYREDGQDDSDKQSESDKGSLIPARKPFKRHMNVVSFLEEQSAMKMAPGADRAPEPNVRTTVTGAPQVKLRRAYESVQQKAGLKQRWIPLGTVGGEKAIRQKQADNARPRSLSAASFLSQASSSSYGNARNSNQQRQSSASRELQHPKIKREPVDLIDDSSSSSSSSSPSKDANASLRKHLGSTHTRLMSSANGIREIATTTGSASHGKRQRIKESPSKTPGSTASHKSGTRDPELMASHHEKDSSDRAPPSTPTTIHIAMKTEPISDEVTSSRIESAGYSKEDKKARKARKLERQLKKEASRLRKEARKVKKEKKAMKKE